MPTSATTPVPPLRLTTREAAQMLAIGERTGGRGAILAAASSKSRIIMDMEPYRKIQALKELFQSVTASSASWRGTVYRAVGTEYANKRDLLSGEGTKRFGGRWTAPGSFATVHASLNHCA